MNNFPKPSPNSNEDSSSVDNVIIHPETGQKFDASTGLPIEEAESSPQDVSSNKEETSSVSETHPPVSVLPEPKIKLPEPPENALPKEPSKRTDVISEEKTNNTIPQPPRVFPKPEHVEREDVNTSAENDKVSNTRQEALPVANNQNYLENNAELKEERNVAQDTAVSLDNPTETESGEKTLKEQIRKSKWEAGGRPSQNKTKIPDNISVRDWDDNTEDDPIYGLGSDNDVKEKKNKPKTNQKLVLNERDYIMMSFMTRYRYCYSDQLARLVGAENKDIRARLTKLEKAGYIRREVITRNQDLWLTRKAGLQIIGSPYAAIQKGQVSTLYIQHTIGVGNLAVELEMGDGGKNILGEEEFPKMNRYPYGMYNPGEEASVLGEMTVTEREIRSANRVLRGGNQETTLDLKYKVEAAVNDTTAPERLEGNEWMFVVYGKGEHVPDLVVHRPRGENGKPAHIAIELELTAKDLPGWRRILKWYKEYGIMYDKVYYFTHSRTIATRLQKVIDELDLAERVIVRKYIPNNNRGPFWG